MKVIIYLRRPPDPAQILDCKNVRECWLLFYTVYHINRPSSRTAIRTNEARDVHACV